MTRRGCRMALVALPALALSVPAWSAGPPPRIADDKTVDVAITLTRDELDLDYRGGSPVATTLERIGLTWDERVVPNVEIGMFGGYLFLTQSDNPALAGLEPNGYFGGVALRAVLFQTSSLQFFFQGQYSYERVTASDTQRNVTLRWDAPAARVGASFRPADRLRLYGGGSWGKFEGQENVTGTVPHTTSFDSARHTGAFVGIDFALEDDGYVGIEARSGMTRGAEIYFKKRY